MIEISQIKHVKKSTSDYINIFLKKEKKETDSK